jgi:elongator complex protein 3
MEIELIEEFLKSSNYTRDNLEFLKRKYSKKYKKKLLRNSSLIEAYHKILKGKTPDPEVMNVLRIRSIRSLSGIVIVSVLTKSYPCPGNCVFCPSQADIPKSYLAQEPAVARAIMFDYHPYKQVAGRLKALQATGHPIDKIDIRIIGGTWSYYEKNYQNWFVNQCFKAANEFSGKKSKTTLENNQKMNESANNRIIGLTIETRPDYINDKEIKRLRKLGVTRVELGVQSIYDEVLKLNKRGHNIQQTIDATKLLKDAGFKVCYQLMPNLWGSTFEKDIEMFKTLFNSPEFHPDYIKIYPCSLLKEAPLYKAYVQGKYKPYNEKELTKLLLEIKKTIPYYCRIQRIIRDIPSDYVVEGGTKTTNLRQVLEKQSLEQGWKCKCIRCREVKDNYDPNEKLYLKKIEYGTLGGKEIFLSYENKDNTRLYSLIRLRIPDNKDELLVRELHTYGQLLPISKTGIAPQHKGLGKKLMLEAEKIAREYNKKYVSVISGVGVRGYYRKLGYRLKNTYMVKIINK